MFKAAETRIKKPLRAQEKIRQALKVQVKTVIRITDGRIASLGKTLKINGIPL